MTKLIIFSCIPSSHTDIHFSSLSSSSQEMTDLTNPVTNLPKAVTKLHPFTMKKIWKENDSDQSHHLTKDEKVAKNLNIPYSVKFIIKCSMEEFNDILNNKSLHNEQISLCRDIRRRGKNKVIDAVNVGEYCYITLVSDCRTDL